MTQEVFWLFGKVSWFSGTGTLYHTLSSLFVGLSPLKWYLKRRSSGCTITSNGNKIWGSALCCFRSLLSRPLSSLIAKEVSKSSSEKRKELRTVSVNQEAIRRSQSTVSSDRLVDGSLSRAIPFVPVFFVASWKSSPSSVLSDLRPAFPGGRQDEGPLLRLRVEHPSAIVQCFSGANTVLGPGEVKFVR